MQGMTVGARSGHKAMHDFSYPTFDLASNEPRQAQLAAVDRTEHTDYTLTWKSVQAGLRRVVRSFAERVAERFEPSKKRGDSLLWRAGLPEVGRRDDGWEGLFKS